MVGLNSGHNLSMRKQAVTLIELLIAIALLSVITIGFSSINLFSQHHTISASRRADLQNDVSFAIAHMGKYVQQGVGDLTNPPLEQRATDGFRVRVDLKPTPTPGILDDDLWFNYYLDADDTDCPSCLKFSCTQISATDSPACPSGEILSKKILAGVEYIAMPVNLSSGFYINLTDNNTIVEVGLVARYNKGLSQSADNPQVEMKNRLYTYSSSNR